MNRSWDLESSSRDVAPGTWRSPTNPDRCCIYRVPTCLRHVNPEAYTPQFVLIGPLHHFWKSQALQSGGDITNTKAMNYLNMERHKKIYLAEFAKRFEGEKSIDRFRRVIKEEEDMIRASYAESTDWIESPDFVEMILHDSVFILELMLRDSEKSKYEKTGDPLMDELCLKLAVWGDLILLENQLPFFLLEKLFDPILGNLRTLVTTFFFFWSKTKIDIKSKFRHFTDLFRWIHVETLPGHFLGEFDEMEDIYHADKLHRGGVKFNVVDKNFSLDVEFKNGCLNIPCFYVHDHSEITLRNIMALEQCHYASNTHVCNHVLFFDFLIDTNKDVELLIEKGIIKNRLGHHGSMATMVNRLCLGVSHFGSYHSVIANDVQNYYHNPWNKSRAVLKNVYFSNPLKGTATVVATFLLLLTLIQTVTSIIQVLQNETPFLAL